MNDELKNYYSKDEIDNLELDEDFMNSDDNDINFNHHKNKSGILQSCVSDSDEVTSFDDTEFIKTMENEESDESNNKSLSNELEKIGSELHSQSVVLDNTDNINSAGDMYEEVEEEVEEEKIETDEYKKREMCINDLISRYDVSEEKITTLEEMFSQIVNKSEDVISENGFLNESDLKEFIKDGREAQYNKYIHKVATNIADSIVEGLKSDTDLTLLNANNTIVKKEKLEFILNCTETISKWNDVMKNNADELLENKYILKLLKDLDFTVANINIYMLTRTVKGSSGFVDFLKFILPFFSEMERIVIAELIDKILDENIENNLRIETIFKL